MTEGPKRLMTEEGRLGAAIAVARRQAPTDEELAALTERLIAAGAPLPAPIRRREPAPSPKPAPAAPHAKRGWWVAAGGALGLGVAIVLAGLAARTTKNQGAAVPTSAPAVSTQALPSADSSVGAGAPNRAVQPHSENTRVEPPASAARSEEQPPEVAPPVAEAPLAAASGTRAAAPPTADVARVDPATRAAPRKSSAPSPADSSPTPSGAVLGPVASPPSELELLKKARSALTVDPAQSLALAEQCAAAYPQGALAQEREFIAISALARVGRVSEARSRAERFRSRYPHSAYLPKLQGLLENP